ncbi:zinc finger BED domain-containing protein 2 isoform X3 [Nycticebus coucang]|nr:zinc finger BED domain-containing protein 2 isoform X3 [Nycticebus coucang]
MGGNQNWKCPPPGGRSQLTVIQGVQKCIHSAPERSETSPAPCLPNPSHGRLMNISVEQGTSKRNMDEWMAAFIVLPIGQMKQFHISANSHTL